MNETNINSEREYKGLLVNGFAMLFFTWVLIPALIALVAWLGFGYGREWISIVFGIPLLAIFFLGLAGYFTQEPGQSRVMIFFGKYVGTCRKVGYFWTNPFITRRPLSLRMRNMDIDPIKVNDKVGNPVLIGMVLVWKIRNTYRAVFDIDDARMGLEHFVRVQSDAALREVAGHFAYDQSDGGHSELTLRDGGEEVSRLLETKINERLDMAGIEVVEARINYLAYAPEIAAVMLRRQQAAAIISAREKIVEGAVSMVDLALRKLEKDQVCVLSADRRAALASNLLVVLCADEPAQPVIPTQA